MDAEGNTSMPTAPDQTEAAEHYFKCTFEQVPARRHPRHSCGAGN